MGYSLHGTFLQACNCRLLCRRWIDDDPGAARCTGLFAWSVGMGSTADDCPVADARVVHVANRFGRRRDGTARSTYSALFVDTSDLPRATRNAAFAALRSAFSGATPGPLADLTANGKIVLVGRAAVTMTEAGDTCTLRVLDAAGTRTLEAVLKPARFDGRETLTLRRTARSKELGIADHEAVAAHRCDALIINLAALPGGYVDVVGRSGMRGPFHYVYRDRATATAATQPPPFYGYTTEEN